MYHHDTQAGWQVHTRKPQPTIPLLYAVYRHDSCVCIAINHDASCV